MSDKAMRGMGFGASDTGPYVSELRESLEGVSSAHVDWAPGAAKLSPDERAKHILDAQWQIMRGHCVRMDHFTCRWWHFRCKFREGVAAVRRWRDIHLLKLDPYGIRRGHD